MIEKVIKKFNYSEYLAEFLRKLYPFLIEYFKDEELIFNALINTPIYIGYNSYDLLKKLDMLDSDGLVQDSDLKRSSGVKSSKVKMSYSNNEFVIDDVVRVVGIESSDITSEYAQDALIHELCHLIKSYYNEYSIDKDVLIQRDGLIRRFYKLSVGDNGVKKAFLKEYGIGFEEGLNTIAEEWIAKQVIGSDFKISGYQTIAQLAKNVLINQQILQEVIDAELYKKDINLNGYYEEFIQITDKIYQVYLELFASMFDRVKFDKINQELHDLIINVYNPLLDKILTNSREV